jgi:hypothetical protein
LTNPRVCEWARSSFSLSCCASASVRHAIATFST